MEYLRDEVLCLITNINASIGVYLLGRKVSGQNWT